MNGSFGAICALFVLSLTGCPKITQPTKNDALDGITGTESWRHKPENISQEWKEWYRARVAWRQGYREMKVQRVRSVRIADLVERFPEGPAMEEVQQVLQSRTTQLPAHAGVAPGPEPAPIPTPGPDRITPGPSPMPGPAALPPDPGQHRVVVPPKPAGPASRDHGKDPPSWAKVPVERLDADGQAIDDEGDQEVDRVFKKRKRKKRR